MRTPQGRQCCETWSQSELKGWQTSWKLDWSSFLSPRSTRRYQLIDRLIENRLVGMADYRSRIIIPRGGGRARYTSPSLVVFSFMRLWQLLLKQINVVKKSGSLFLTRPPR
jgi:hypothetical protein